MEDITSLPFLKVSGTYQKIGYQIGQKFKKRIRKAFEESIFLQQRLKWDEKDPYRVDHAEFITKKRFPNYMQEIQGLAEGAEMDYRKILVANFMHLPEVPDCSTILLKYIHDTAKNESNIDSQIEDMKEKNLIIHNEDHEWRFGHHSYLVHINYPDGNQIFSHCYPGVIPGVSFGFNSYGVAITCNYVPDPNPKIGVPRTIIGRWILDANCLEVARSRAIEIIPRAGGVNYNITSVKSKKIVNIETTADDHCITNVDTRLFHANHYSSQKFKHFPILDDFGIRSVARYNRGQELLTKTGENLSKVNALEIMWDPLIHMNPETQLSDVKGFTICTSVFTLEDTLNMELYKKPNIITPFFKYSMEDFED